ncbi:hypothetical protein AE1304_17230 [Aeromonas enteropelogenes]
MLSKRGSGDRDIGDSTQYKGAKTGAVNINGESILRQGGKKQKGGTRRLCDHT